MACTPAAHAKGERLAYFEITRAAGSVQVAFHGNEAAGCRERGVCGVSGTVTRSYGNPSSGRLFWLRRGTRTLIAHGFIDEGRGEIVSDVGTAGSTERCIDRVATTFDTFDLRPRRGRLRFVWSQIGGGWIASADHLEGEGPPEDLLTNPFGTRCTGPGILDIARALPQGEIPFRVLRSRRSQFHLTGSAPFAAGGFAGAVEWSLRYGLRLRRTRAG
jgi:hypothetical protein